MAANGEGNGSLVLRWVHVWILVVTNLLALGAIYGTIKFQVEDHERRIRKLEDSHFIPGPEGVSIYQFNEMREDILRRLARIETKIDDQVKR